MFISAVTVGTMAAAKTETVPSDKDTVPAKQPSPGKRKAEDDTHMDVSQVSLSVSQCVLFPELSNLYSKYIIWQFKKTKGLIIGG